MLFFYKIANSLRCSNDLKLKPFGRLKCLFFAISKESERWKTLSAQTNLIECYAVKRFRLFLRGSKDYSIFNIKEEPHFGPKRVPSRNQYQWIDLIEYYKSYNKHKVLGRGRQALEGAKVNFFLSIFYNF